MTSISEKIRSTTEDGTRETANRSTPISLNGHVERNDRFDDQRFEESFEYVHLSLRVDECRARLNDTHL